MNLLRRCIYCILMSLCFLVFPKNGYAFFNDDFHIFTTQNGLADNKVNCIFKDADGFMWFGTDFGLSLYNGSSFNNFTIVDSNNHIHSIHQLNTECIGVLTEENKLYAFNLQQAAFIPIVGMESYHSITGLYPMSDGTCWLLTDTAVVHGHFFPQLTSKGDIGQLLFKEITQKKLREITSGAITCHAFYPQQSCLYLTDSTSHLIRYHLLSEKVEKRIFIPQLSVRVTQLFKQDKNLWISTVGAGLVRYDESDDSLDYFIYNASDPNRRISHTDIYGVVPISSRKLLIPSWNGYTVLTSDDETFDTPDIQIYNNASITNQHIEPRMICGFCDAGSSLWIGTYGGGVLFSDLRKQFIHQFRQSRHNEITGMAIDGQGYLWMTTYHKGLMKTRHPFDPLAELHFDYLDATPEGKHTTALCLHQDTLKQEMYVGRQDGQLSVFQVEKNHHRTIRLFPDGVENHEPVWCMVQDRQHNFWIGTGQSLLYYTPQDGKCRSIPVAGEPGKGLTVRSLVVGPDGTVWVGTEYNGLAKVVDGEIVLAHGDAARLRHASVRSLLVSADHKLYIGSTTGLLIMDLQNERSVNFFTTRNGLINNSISCLLQDDYGHIWVGSNTCISRYSRNQKLFYHYFLSGSNSSVCAYDRYLLWGNNRNLTYFNPEEISRIKNNEKIAIHTLEINNKMVEIGESVNGQVLLSKNLYHTRALKLHNANRNFSLGFNSLSYNNQYQKVRYRLYPYQKEWIVTDNQQKVSYNNLKADTYAFQIQNMYTNEQMGPLTELQVTILPHWSETWWFRLAILAFVMTVIYRFIRYLKLRQARFRRMMELKHEVLVTRLERDKEKQLRVERENFFTNTAHELRTPLTLIISPLHEIISKLRPDHELFPKLNLIYQNSSALHDLTDQLLYIQKMEAGMVKLQLSETDVVSLVAETCKAFQPLAVNKHIQLHTDFPSHPYFLWIDADKMTSVVQNLISNALKYTKENDCITVEIKPVTMDDTGFCCIEVADTGIGIDEELQEHIFESFTTGVGKPQFSTQMGIGLQIVKHTIDMHHGKITLHSRQGQGTTFTVLIPEGNSHFELDDCIYLSEKAPVQQVVQPVYTAGMSPVEASAGKKQTLLIVEDNEDIRSFIHSIFSSEFRVIEAENGEEGVRLAVEHLPSVIICDLMMPVKDGIDCSREIKENPQTTHIPILILTAKTEDADILAATRVGVDDYVMKPFIPEVLVMKVKNLILQRERLKRIYTKSLMLTNHAESKDSSDTNGFIQQVIHVIEANLSDESFNVKKLADELHMSQPTLYRKLKQVSQLNAIDMIRSIRMSKAAALILEQKYSIQEISEMVGYSDARTLRKHFTEQFGTSPSQFVDKGENIQMEK